VLSRLRLCPDKGQSLRSFYKLPSDSVLIRSKYFAVAFMFMLATRATMQMLARTTAYGLAHKHAEKLAVWPENTPMNCAAVEAKAGWSELHPAMYSSDRPCPDKRIWHMDGFKPGRKLSDALQDRADDVAAACKTSNLDLEHPFLASVW